MCSWNVEEFSTFSDETGGLCWIRCVVDDYINGLMTMTSSWHLIGAFCETVMLSRFVAPFRLANLASPYRPFNRFLEPVK